MTDADVIHWGGGVAMCDRRGWQERSGETPPPMDTQPSRVTCPRCREYVDALGARDVPEVAHG
jgi:hypothetical protein